ncbi:MAG: hypothetical protein LUI09_02155 [Prevotellaceae bacterium]|nr:hypothetical protein [Prevotellaceae bacterium]
MVKKKKEVERVPRVWTPEYRAEIRKSFPERLNKFGEWLFSDDSNKEYFTIVDEKAVLK